MPCRGVCAEGNLDDIRKAQLTDGRLELADICVAKMALDCRGKGGNDRLAALEGLNHRDNVRTVRDRAERAADHAGATADAAAVIDRSAVVVVLADRIDRARADAGTHGIGNRIVRAGRRTASALFTFGRVDVCALAGDGNRAKRTGRLAFFRQTFLAVICNRKAADRTALAGSRQNADNAPFILARKTDPLCRGDTLADNLPLAVDTAAESRHGARDNVIRNLLDMLIQCSLKGILRYLGEHLIF